MRKLVLVRQCQEPSAWRLRARAALAPNRQWEQVSDPQQTSFRVALRALVLSRASLPTWERVVVVAEQTRKQAQASLELAQPAVQASAVQASAAQPQLAKPRPARPQSALPQPARPQLVVPWSAQSAPAQPRPAQPQPALEDAEERRP